MLTQQLFFALGIASNIALITIFLLVRAGREDDVRRAGWAYTLLALPAVYTIIMVAREQQSVRYTIFLCLFLAFVALETLYDRILHLHFRQDWRLLVPYLALYWAMNYGFVVMVWQMSMPRGLLMLGLATLQMVANIGTHLPLRTTQQA